MHEKIIFEHSAPGRSAEAQFPLEAVAAEVPEALRRQSAPLLPEVSELQAVRHFTRLSHLNFSIDTHFYPLGSCTMKYNPRACNQYAMLPEFLARHPFAPDSTGQGILECLYELQEMLKEVTGMKGVSLTPMAGAQGEFAGVAMIGVGRGVLPSNCGSHWASAASISVARSRASFSVRTALVSGSIAHAATASSGSPVMAAWTASPCTLTLLWFSAANCGGRSPTNVGCRPILSTNNGTSTQQPRGRLVI